MIDFDNIILAGKILKPHGLKGEMNVISEYPPEILNLGYPAIIDMDGIYVPFYVESYRSKNTHSALIKFQGVESAEETRRFVNKDFYLLRKDVAEYMQLDEDEIETDIDIAGYKIIDIPTGFHGRVIDTYDNGVYLLMEVESDDDTGTVTMPFVDEFIKDIDTESKIIQTSMPDGLIDSDNAYLDN